MVLKRGTSTLIGSVTKKLQSNHYGIETATHLSLKGGPAMLQSNHYGIETQYRCKLLNQTLCCNRTIMVLKLPQFFSFQALLAVVAIEPLWY